MRFEFSYIWLFSPFFFQTKDLFVHFIRIRVSSHQTEAGEPQISGEYSQEQRWHQPALCAWHSGNGHGWAVWKHHLNCVLKHWQCLTAPLVQASCVGRHCLGAQLKWCSQAVVCLDVLLAWHSGNQHRWGLLGSIILMTWDLSSILFMYVRAIFFLSLAGVWGVMSIHWKGDYHHMIMSLPTLLGSIGITPAL